MGSSESKAKKSSDKSGCLGFKKSNGAKHEIALATLGLDNAGKTSIVLALSKELDSTEDIMPTVGFDSKKIHLSGHTAMMYDLGGGSKIRGIWKNYFAEVHGVVFVVDAADPNRVEESAKEFRNLAKNAYIHGKPMLILANKSDKTDALSEYELTEMMNLEEIVNVNKIPTKVQASTTVTKDHKTLNDGMKWLFMSISAEWEELNERVQREAEEIKEKQKADRRERMERIRKQKEEREAAEGVSQEDNEDDADVVDGADPFQSLKDHLNTKTSAGAAKSKKGKKVTPRTPREEPSHDSSNSGDDEIAIVTCKYSADRDLKNNNSSESPQIKTEDTSRGVSSLFNTGDVVIKRPERVPSPLPAPFGDGLNTLPSRLPPIGGGLPPLGNSSPLKPLELVTDETTTKKKKKRKKKARISPTNDANGLMPVEEEVG